MRRHLFDHIGKCPITIISINSVGIIKVVTDPQIRPTIRIVVPPGCREPKADPVDSSFPAHIGKLPTIVAEQDIRLAHFLNLKNGTSIYFLPRLIRAKIVSERRIGKTDLADSTLNFEPQNILGFWLPLGRVEAIGQEIEIEVPITVIVTECRHVTRAEMGQTKCLGLLVKGRVTSIDKELVGGGIVGHVDVQVTISFDVDHRSTRTPNTSPINSRKCAMIGKF